MLERDAATQNEEGPGQSFIRLVAFRDTFKTDLREFKAACKESVIDDPAYQTYINETLQEAETLMLRLNHLLNNSSDLQDFHEGAKGRRSANEAQSSQFPGVKEVHEAWKSALAVMEKMRWEKSRLSASRNGQ